MKSIYLFLIIFLSFNLCADENKKEIKIDYEAIAVSAMADRVFALAEQMSTLSQPPSGVSPILKYLIRYKNKCQEPKELLKEQKSKVIDLFQKKGISTSSLLENEPKCADEQEVYYKKVLEQLSLIYPDINSSSTVTLEKKE